MCKNISRLNITYYKMHITRSVIHIKMHVKVDIHVECVRQSGLKVRTKIDDTRYAMDAPRINVGTLRAQWTHHGVNASTTGVEEIYKL